MERKTRLARKQAQSMTELIDEFIREMKISSRLNDRRIFEAWRVISNASKNTIRMYFRSGTLYVTLNSSTLRSQLSFQIDDLTKKINDCLMEDPLFTKDDPFASKVEKIVLK